MDDYSIFDADLLNFKAELLESLKSRNAKHQQKFGEPMIDTTAYPFRRKPEELDSDGESEDFDEDDYIWPPVKAEEKSDLILVLQDHRTVTEIFGAESQEP